MSDNATTGQNLGGLSLRNLSRNRHHLRHRQRVMNELIFYGKCKCNKSHDHSLGVVIADEQILHSETAGNRFERQMLFVRSFVREQFRLLVT